MKGLAISVGRTGKVILHCHSCGADIVQVIRALEGVPADEIEVAVRKVKTNGGGKVRHLRPGMQWWVEKTGVPEDVWHELGCVEEGSGVAFLFDGQHMRKVRTPPKDFKWVGHKGGDVPPLWPAPNDDLPDHVWFLEGESDTGTAAAAGHYAFGITKGAGRGEKRYIERPHFEALKARGVKEITICGDADESGENFMTQMSHAAVDAGLTVNIVRLAKVCDPFSGIKDLNGVWREADNVVHFHDLVARATERVATRYPVLSVDDLETLATEEIEWLIPELFAPSDKALLSGPQKSYKTWILLDLLRSLATCSPFLSMGDWTPKRTVRCLLVEEEGSPGLWARRIRRLRIPKKHKPNLMFMHRQGIRFTERDTIDELIAVCRENEIEFLALDPLQRMMPGVNENDSSETGIVWDEIMRIQMAIPGIVILVVHHSNKAERLNWESVRGSSRHAGEVDLGVFVEKVDKGIVKVSLDGRDIPQYLDAGETFEARVHISTDKEEPSFKVDASPIQVNVNQVKAGASRNKDRVLQAVFDGCKTIASIASQAEVSDNTCKKYLHELTEEGLIEETDPGAGRAKLYNPKEE